MNQNISSVMSDVVPFRILHVLHVSLFDQHFSEVFR